MADLVDRLEEALGGRYSIECELGSGGAGVVYRAEDVRHDRKVALKVLRPEIAQTVGAERFLQEIRIAARLSHPHILSLIDSGEEGGFLYYVMFYVSGESLRDRLIREVQLPVDEAVRLAREAADALDYAHAAGVIHRDIKPENILIEAGHALVCDFGIAKAMGEAGISLTETGLTVGTPAYMSPEQASGEEVDSRTDLYSLGCVLYEMLAGGAPYHGATPQSILARKLAEPVPSVRIVRETVPEHVEAALERALARVPADRFATGAEFADALADESFAPRPTKRSTAGPTWGRYLKHLVGAVALTAVGLYGYLALRGGDAPVPIRTAVSPVTAQPGVEDSPSISPDGQWVVYAGEGPSHRDIFLVAVGGQRNINLTEDSGADDYAPVFSPDGNQIAFRSSREGGGLFVMGRTGEAVRRVTSAGFNPAWSPDGTRLVYATEHVGLLPLNWEGTSEIWIADVSTGETRQLDGAIGVEPSWSPDGRWIAYTVRMVERSEMDIWIIPVEGGEPQPATSDLPADWCPTWSPDGEYIYFSSNRGGSMNLWRVPMSMRTGTPTGEPEPITTPATTLAHPSVSRDGLSVAYSNVQMTQNVWKAAIDATAGTLSDIVPITTGSREWSSPDPTSDGSWVAFYSRNLPEGDLYVVRGDGTGTPRLVTGDSALDRVPRWSPDGSRLAYFSNRSGALQLWGIRADGSENGQLTGAEHASWGEWSPDGNRLAVNAIHEPGTPRTVIIFDPNRPWGEQEVMLLPPQDSSIGQFNVNDWSPGGTLLAGMNGVQDTGILLYDLSTQSYERLTDFGQWPVWLDDGRTILFVSGGSTFYLIDTRTREIREIYSSRRDVLGPPRATGDGREIVFTRRITEGDIWLVSLQ